MMGMSTSADITIVDVTIVDAMSTMVTSTG